MIIVPQFEIGSPLIFRHSGESRNLTFFLWQRDSGFRRNDGFGKPDFQAEMQPK